MPDRFTGIRYSRDIMFILVARKSGFNPGGAGSIAAFGIFFRDDSWLIILNIQRSMINVCCWAKVSQRQTTSYSGPMQPIGNTTRRAHVHQYIQFEADYICTFAQKAFRATLRPWVNTQTSNNAVTCWMCVFSVDTFNVSL